MMVVNEITKLFLCNIIALVLVVTICLMVAIIDIYRFPKKYDLDPITTEDTFELFRLISTCLGINLFLLSVLILMIYQ